MVHRTLAEHRKARRVFLPVLLTALIWATAMAGCRSGKTSSVAKAPTAAMVSTDTAVASGPVAAAPATEAPPEPTAAGPEEALTAASDTWSVTILHTNDVTGEIDPCG